MTTADMLTPLLETFVFGAPLFLVWSWALWRALHTPRSSNRWQSWIGSVAVVLIVVSILLPNVYRLVVKWLEGNPHAVPFAFGIIRLISGGIEAVCWFVVLRAAFHGEERSTGNGGEPGPDF